MKLTKWELTKWELTKWEDTVYNQDTIGGQYEFRSFVICREVVIFWEVIEL